MSTSVTYTGVLQVKRGTVEYLARLLFEHRRSVGTRAGTRALGCFAQAVLVLRWFVEGARAVQLAVDNDLGTSTVYEYLHEGIDVLAAQAPDLSEVLDRVRRDGVSHVNLDGTVIATDRCRTPGPTKGVDLWWSGKHRHHGGNIQVLSTPDGWPLWTSEVRPGREHDTTCAKAAPGLLDGLEALAHDEGIVTLTDLGYHGLNEAFPDPAQETHLADPHLQRTGLQHALPRRPRHR